MTSAQAGAMVVLRAQCAALGPWFAARPAVDFEQPTVLPGWDLRALLGHLVLVVQGCARGLSRPTDEPAVPAADYVRRYRRDVAHIEAATREVTADRTPAQLVDALAAATAALPSDPPPGTIVGGRGPISSRDWVRTRTVDVVVHADDLAATFPESPPPIEHAALADATRMLAEMFAAQLPGRSVELRVPPFVAVQAVPGPRHTRGTPPNVVETDPVTWLRLATGRVDFATAVATGRVRASGERSDLGANLPVLS